MAKETIEVPMPGKILSVKVKVGDSVKEDDEICILEAMKMETEITTPIGGKVAEVKVSLGDSVKSGQVVLVWE